MKAGDDISLCGGNAEYAIYGNEEKNSASSSSLQLQPEHCRGGADPTVSLTLILHWVLGLSLLLRPNLYKIL